MKLGATSSNRLRRHTSVHGVLLFHGQISASPRMLMWTLLATIVVFSATSTLVCAQDALTQGKTLRSLGKAWNANLSDWSLTDDPCLGNWTGITCEATNSKVISVRLVNKSLYGSIPKEIGQLVFLEQLDLTNNSIQGGIPTEIGKLTNLQVLTLDGNSLTSLPPQELLFCNLTELSMHGNQINGKIPSWIGQMVQLVKLDLYTNNLWGGLPPEYGNLKNLQTLELWENQLSGYIPDEWRGMTSIVNLNLPRNQFMGPFPNITALLRNGISNFTKLGLNCNFFTGKYPQQYYDTLPPGVNITINYTPNCFDNETDTNPTINRLPNVTQNTPRDCERQWACGTFLQYVAQEKGNCAPCPSGQIRIDVSKCICGKEEQLPNTSKKFPVGAVVGGIVGGVCAILVALLLMLVYYKHSTRVLYPEFGRTYEGSDEPWIVPKELRRFKLQELEKATNNFDEKCFTGSGGFGKVYRGVLLDGTVVAIKCASLQSAQGQTEFRNELTLLSRLHHRNLVKLEGFCDDDGLQILVYEFMENGDLHDNLFGKKGKFPLNSIQRLEVVLGVARGLDYLHSFADPPVIHRDIKLSNVLLSHSMVPKLSDFGVSRASAEYATHVSTAPIGTRGYLDPDYFRTNQLTTASDVYAFGIVLLEIITGLPVIDYTRLDASCLDAWARPRFNEGGIRAIIDRKLDIGYNEALYTDMAHLALRCAQHDRTLRPTMKDVLSILEPYGKTILQVPSPEWIGWSTSHFTNKSLFEPETPMGFERPGSRETSAAELYPLKTALSHSPPGSSAFHSPGPSECFTNPKPR
ncbi:uncharacterized protein [Physcomitrium patens]|uniref:Protein kinase domain-containing protein n=1 Tax=Physcomitrium patens TaxID=3218 RepID=A0A7I4BXB6_PHYPA|nr:LRR receptor kinase BAK1-like isoform X2 [Physcomitrium patens]|eukprot:XP_024395783.1 LRR receptor kinase BAK1-like isoform X2 [Physcomitrella patens]